MNQTKGHILLALRAVRCIQAHFMHLPVRHKKMLDHIQKNFGYLRVVETFPGKTCKQVLIIDKDGNLKRQQIIAGDFNAHFDILNLAALSTLPQFTPATLKGKAVPTQIMVYTKLF